MVGIARQRHEFRASWWIRGAAALALLLWVGIGSWAVAWGALSAKALLGIGFFVTFFVGFVVYYWRIRYTVDDSGITVRGAPALGQGGRRHFPWETIEAVTRSDVPLGGWEVSTSNGPFVLDVFVGRRALLLDVIVARAGLFPTAR